MPLQHLCDLSGGLWSTQRFVDLWFCFLVMGPVSVWGVLGSSEAGGFICSMSV